MKWNRPQFSKENIDWFTKHFGCQRASASLLLSRGISKPEQLRYYLDKDLHLLHSPFLFRNMNKVVQRIQQAISEGERVLVFGDRDSDGITAISLLVSALRREGLEVFWDLPKGDDPYALRVETLNEYARQDISLCITVDCGISNIEEVQEARDLGIDCIIVDHHEPSEKLPNAKAIINPKCEGESYPFTGASAVVLVMKCIQALEISKCEFYETPFCLVNCRPGKDSVIIDAVKICNLRETARLSETIVDGSGEDQIARIINFIQDQVILVYQEKLQSNSINRIFGNSRELAYNDISSNIWEIFPNLKDMTLLRMLSGSKMSRFSSQMPNEIDAGAQLFIRYLSAKYPRIIEVVEECLDLVVIGLLADMVPLEDENRIIAYRGLQKLNTSKRRGLKELMARLNLNGRSYSTSTDVSMRLAPALNSTGRMGKPELAVSLLLEEGNIMENAGKIIELNEERKKLCSTLWQSTLPEARQSIGEYNQVFSLVKNAKVPRGITGLLASRLSTTLQLPSIVLAPIGDQFSASARGTEGSFHITDFLSRFSDIFLSFGGHPRAGGFRFHKDRYTDFLNRLKEQAQYLDPANQDEPELYIDIELDPTEFSENIEQFQCSMEPFGQSFKPIVYLLRSVQLRDLRFIGKRAEHLRLQFLIHRQTWPAVFWSAADRSDLKPGAHYTIVFNIERDYFASNSKLQLNILDMREPPIN